MISLPDLLIFSGAALLMVLTPGPNMIYLISRSICQGRGAGVISLFGVIAGFFVHMLAAAIGLTAIFLAIPLAYEILKWLGTLYLLWLAWQAVKPGGHRHVVRAQSAVAGRTALRNGRCACGTGGQTGFRTAARLKQRRPIINKDKSHENHRRHHLRQPHAAADHRRCADDRQLQQLLGPVLDNPGRPYIQTTGLHRPLWCYSGHGFHAQYKRHVS